MIKDIWINLPVKDVARASAFFTAIGFTFNAQYGTKTDSASFIVGKQNLVLMLFDEASFKGFSNGEVADNSQGTEALFSIGVDNKEAVDEIAAKAIEAGGTSNHLPTEMKGWMYGCLFLDPDGHKWNALYMDMSKM